MRTSPALGLGVKTIVPSGPQAAPRLRSRVASVMGEPPATGIFLSSLRVTKPSHWPSGEKKAWYGPASPSPFTSTVSWKRSSGRTTSACCWPSSPVVYAIARPSGEVTRPEPRREKSWSSVRWISKRRIGSAKGFGPSSRAPTASPSSPAATATVHGSQDARAGGAHRLRRHGARVLEELLERDARVADRLEPPRGVLLQALLEQRPQRRRHARRQLREVGLLVHDRAQHVRHRLAVEGAPAGEHLVEHAAEGPDVRAAVDGLAARLLRAHVAGGAEQHARLRHRERGRVRGLGVLRPGERVGVERLGQAEVEHLDAAVAVDHDVRGLQVAVHDALLVRGLERLGDPEREAGRLLRLERAALQPGGERLAGRELHHEEALAVALLETVDAGDARVGQRREHARLALEAREPLGVAREARGQQLERDVAAELRVLGAEDLAHAAGAELGRDLVVGDRGADQSRAPPLDVGRADCIRLFGWGQVLDWRILPPG